MQHLMMHHAMQEAMQMTRLTVTVPDTISQEMSGLQGQAAEVRAEIGRVLETLPADEAAVCYTRLHRSLDELSMAPRSSSAVVRQALDLYFDLLHDARGMAAMDAGYRALAADSEREELVEVMSKRAPSRWDLEP